MDINSLLSPQDSPVSDEPDVTASAKLPAAALKRAHSSTTATKETKNRPPLPQSSFSHSAVGRIQHSPSSSPLGKGQSPGTRNGGSGDHGNMKNGARPGASRQGSTPGMDTLAELASMQHHQQTARAKAGRLRSVDVYESPERAQNAALSNLSGLPGSGNSGKASVDKAMTEMAATSTPPPPRTFLSASLPEEDLSAISELASFLAENPYSFDSHVQLVKLLRQGLINHYSTEAGQNDPHGYELLGELHQAREAMDARFPLGEEMWTEWIVDEKRASKSAEDCVAVMELCKKAVSEELASPKLWLEYGSWVTGLYDKLHSPEIPTSIAGEEWLPSSWSEEDAMVGRELFGWDLVVDVWKQGVRETHLRLNDSHLVWDRYIEAILADVARHRRQQKIGHAKDLFMERLQTPHASWDTTFQAFSTFITTHDNAAYEDTMVNATKRAADGKAKFGMREISEIKLRRTFEAGDLTAERADFEEYLTWELGQVNKKKGGVALCRALFERAVLRFPMDTPLWEEYIFFVLEKAMTGSTAIPILPLLDRATRHCPWSGSLWCQYLLSSEKEGKTFQEIEEVKHTATKRGLMDVGGMEEVLKVHAGWCEYLNRRAFQAKATDEDADVAEVGILSALESVKELGQKKYGKEYEGDPRYRLERIYIEYLSRSKLWDRARKEVWQPLAATVRGNSYEFWIRWYHWEMFVWAQQGGGLLSHPITDRQLQRPGAATSLLKKAINRKNLDWPENILEIFLNHVEQYESVHELQDAIILVHRTSKAIETRRQKEAQKAQEEALEHQQQHQDQAQQQSPEQMEGVETESPTGTKRKRDAEAVASEELANKKSRPDEGSTEANPDPGQHLPASSLLKRDRENSTIIVTNLPVGATETKVRQYFRDCGTINSIKLLPGDTTDALTAHLEFEAQEDVLAAQTKNMKTFEGNNIEVQVGSGTTLYVTNYPSTANEIYIGELFKDFGEIVDIRLPSLKYNTHRRFCYVQLGSSTQAKRALELDGKAVGENQSLVVKISEPSRKRERSGPLHEGRELYVSNVDWAATQEDVKSIFSKYGTVQSVRIPTNLGGKSKGIAFVVFESKESADAAIDLNLTKFKSRILSVSRSVSNPSKRQATNVTKRDSASPAPPATETQLNGHPSASPTPSGDQSRPSWQAIESRTIALLNIPDTVNDARIRALTEEFGQVTKIRLRPDHQGAMVEFADVNDVGKASLALEGREVVPGRLIRIGSFKDLKDQKAEFRSDRIQVGKKTQTGPSTLPVTGHVSRPAQPGARRGGKGGLGIKRGGVGLGGTRANAPPGRQSPEKGEAAKDVKGPKTNADFKAMLTK